MASEDLTIIRISGTTSHKVGHVAQALQALEAVYREVTLLESLVWVAGNNPSLAGALFSEEPQTLSVQSLQGQLIFHGASFASPGFWDFLGKLNPLEVVREFLNDRHRRRQDREYRESAEKRRLDLENFLLENKVVKERVRLLREVGLQVDLRLLTQRFVPSLVQLEAAVNEGLIGEAMLIPVVEAGSHPDHKLVAEEDEKDRNSSVSLARFNHLTEDAPDEES
jgi:hypothetical protein